MPIIKKIRRLYISILMKVFNKNKINNKKIKRFVSSKIMNKIGQRSKRFENLSIIVPCYNHGQFLRSTFESIVKQTLPPDEVIFVDDASTDQTSAYLKQLIIEHKQAATKFKLVRQPQNKGQAAAINHGVELAVNELIMVLNDDDYLMHDAVENTIAIFNQEKDIYLLGSKAIRVYDEYFLKNMKKKTTDFTIGDKILVRKYSPQELLSGYRDKGIDMTHSAMSFSKIAWQAAGGYLTKRSERVIVYTDRDFQIRVSLLYVIGVVGDAPFSFWRSSSSVDGGLFT